jgi:hypothetical protein
MVSIKKIKFKIHRLYTVICGVFLVAFLDVTVTSSSNVALRYLYDIFLALLFLPLSYILVILLLNKGLNNSSYEIGLQRKFFLLISLISNGYVVISATISKKPEIETLSENIILSGLISLPYILTFILVLTNNALILYSLIYKSCTIQFYKLPAYALAVLGLETSATIYAFHIWGLNGVRAALVIIHLLFMALAVYFLVKGGFRSIKVLLNNTDLILTCISFGILMLALTSLGIYNLFSDVSVILSSVLGIIERQSLQPYYNATDYYPAVGGFVSIVFTYMTGLSNPLLTSNSPFIASYLLMPFVLYYFIKLFASDDRIVLLGVCISLLMDGLAIVLLPEHIGEITSSTVNWYISPRTGSLYFSSTSHLWLTPYKSFALTSAIGCCAITAHANHKYLYNILLAASLLFLTFVNPRYTFIAILLILTLTLLGKFNHVRALTIFLLSMTFLGPLIDEVLYKLTTAALTTVNPRLLEVIVKEFTIYQTYTIISLVAALIIASIIYIILMQRRVKRNKSVTHSYDSDLFQKVMKMNLSKNFEGVFIIIIFILLGFIIINAYSGLLVYIKLPLVETISLPLLRYHIFFVLPFAYLLTYNKRKILKLLLILLMYYFGGIISNTLTIAPAFFTCLSIPIVEKINREKRFQKLFFVILLIATLGMLSSTFYFGTIKSITDQEHTDLPACLKILLSFPPGETVYTPSYYTYFVKRLAQISHLNVVQELNNASIVIIDNQYVRLDTIGSLFRVYDIVYNGTRFSILIRGFE